MTPISAAEMISPFYSVLFLGQDKNDRLRTKIAEHSVWKMLRCSSSRPPPPPPASRLPLAMPVIDFCTQTFTLAQPLASAIMWV